MRLDCDKKADKKYKKNNTKTLVIRFYKSDMNLFDYVKSQECIAQYVKELIREDIKRKG